MELGKNNRRRENNISTMIGILEVAQQPWFWNSKFLKKYMELPI